MDLRQSRNYAKYIKSLNWQVEEIRGVYCYVKKFPIIGSSLKIQRPQKKISKEKLLDLVKKYRAHAIYVEPKDKKQSQFFQNKAGFKKAKHTYLASKTLQINLRKSQKALLSDMHHKTRYNIRKVKKDKLVSIKKSEDIKTFCNFWQKCARKQRGMYLSQKNVIEKMHLAFGKQSELFFAYKGQEILAALMCVETKKTCYYMFAGSSKKGKSFFAPTYLVWESIINAKKKGLKAYDFEGIYDERFPIKSWRGFSRFKKSFGGKEVSYPGMLRRYFLPI